MFSRSCFHLKNYIFPTQLEANLIGSFSIPKYRETMLKEMESHVIV